MKTSPLAVSLLLTTILSTDIASAETDISLSTKESLSGGHKKLSQQIQADINQVLDPTGLELMKKHKAYLIGNDIAAWKEGNMYIGVPVRGTPMEGMPKEMKVWIGGEWEF